MNKPNKGANMKLLTVLIAFACMYAQAKDFPSINDTSLVSFERDIKPVFKTACTKCHNGKNELPNITEYSVAFKLRTEIVQRVTSDKTMPMYGKLSESNRDLIKAWVEQGAKK
jgi:hypothetical protein